MKFRLIIDETKDEEVVATVHNRSALTDALEALVSQHTGTDKLPGYLEDEMKLLRFQDIACITVLEGKTVAVFRDGTQYLLKQRLYELEQQLPNYFIRINKSTLANENQLEKFTPTFSGAVDAVFKCGYRDYVSRRCFAAIKRRYEKL